jgi:trans-2,3-dihydro-3-hydroxyanthranilate isomerase
MRTLSFVQVDVFTSHAFEGNQLAVVMDASGLDTEQMQAIAREMNLSETTFVIPRSFEEERDHGHRVRIFTVNEELPFAGHPTLGTAWVLRLASAAPEVWLDLNVGRIPVQFTTDERGEVFGEMRQRDPEFGAVYPREEVARVLGIAVNELDPDLPIQTVSTGVPFTMVPFRSFATLQNLSANWSAMSGYLKDKDSKFLYLVCRETVDPQARLHARMIFYNGEDPATGSAAGCCTAWAVKYGVLASDEQGLIVQGLEVLRPSSIYIRATKKGETISNVRVGGHVAPVIDGKVTL